jgi:HK97 family phage major capsid protein
MTIDEILEQLRAIVEGAHGRDLTDDEVERYEQLETDLAAKRRDQEVRARQAAYDTPVRNDLHVHVAGTPDPNEDLNRAFENYLRTGKPNADLAELRVSGPRMAQETGTDSEGGYTVSPEFRQKLVEVRQAFGGLAAEVDSFSTTTGADLEYPSLDDTANSGDITAEEAAVADGDDLAFGTIALGAFKYTSAGAGTNLPLRVSVELLQDSAFDIQALVARALQTRIMRKQAVDWVNGNGTTLPFGLLHDGLTADVVLDTEATLTYTNLLEAEAALDEAYDGNAKWLMSRSTWVTHIKAMLDTADRPLIDANAQAGIGTRPARMLLGYPVVLDASCNAITADGVAGGFMALGDLREAYALRRVAPFTLIVDPYSRAVNGQVQYHAWERADGNIQNRSAYVTIENITT